MKTKLTILLIATLVSLGAYAQTYYGYHVSAVGYDISDNLDLEAVAYLFGESRSLQQFEERLNDPRTQVSNLDLNNDGFVDYLRVVELHEYGIHSVTVQAVLDRNIFQDVATIDVDRQPGGRFYVQVVGDPYLYGPNYIIEPVYAHVPLIFSWFLQPTYVVWHSPYHWGYYPPRYKRYSCLPTFRYQKQLHVHVNYQVNTYHYSNARRSPRAVQLQHQIHRNDYGQRHPKNSFSSRNSGYNNKYELNRSRLETGSRQQRRSSVSENSSRPTYSQRRNVSSGTDDKAGTGNRYSRSAKTPSSSGQQTRRYESTSQRSTSSSHGQTPSSGSGRSVNDRNETRTGDSSGYNSGSNRQAKVKIGQSSNSGYPGSRSTRSSQVELSSGKTNNNAKVNRRNASADQSVSRQKSSRTKELKVSSNRSNSRSEKRSERSRRN